jgi:hypothetical protein
MVAGLEPTRASACKQESLTLPFTITEPSRESNAAVSLGIGSAPRMPAAQGTFGGFVMALLRGA